MPLAPAEARRPRRRRCGRLIRWPRRCDPCPGQGQSRATGSRGDRDHRLARQAGRGVERTVDAAGAERRALSLAEHGGSSRRSSAFSPRLSCGARPRQRWRSGAAKWRFFRPSAGPGGTSASRCWSRISPSPSSAPRPGLFWRWSLSGARPRLGHRRSALGFELYAALHSPGHAQSDPNHYRAGVDRMADRRRCDGRQPLDQRARGSRRSRHATAATVVAAAQRMKEFCMSDPVTKLKESKPPASTGRAPAAEPAIRSKASASDTASSKC